MERRSNSFEINDDLDGVDDFTNDQNPFDSVNTRLNSKATVPSDIINNDAEFDIPDEPIILPPAYNDTVRVDQPNNGETLAPGIINYYSQYFQLSDAELRKRLFNAITFASTDNNTIDTEGGSGSTEQQTDLYGAVWITASLVMVQFVIKGLVSLIVDNIIYGQRSTIAVDRKEVFLGLVHAIWLFYGYIFLVPFISIQILRRDEVTKFGSVVDLISVYGYSNLSWIPFFIIQDILQIFNSFKAVTPVQWGLLGLGFLKSGFHLYREIENGSQSKLTLSTIVILTFHVIFAVLMMFILF